MGANPRTGELPSLPAQDASAATPRGTQPAAQPSDTRAEPRGVGEGGGSPPHGEGVGAGVTRDVSPPLDELKQGASQGEQLAEVDRLYAKVGHRDLEFPVEEPAADDLPPVAAMVGHGDRPAPPPGPPWGRELPGSVRLSEGYRLAVYREGEDYFLVEMVREASGLWRERVVLGEEGFDVIEGKMLELVVENTSP